MSKEYFSRVAPEWDTLRRGYFSETLRDKAIALVAPRAGELAADIGTGTGFMSEGLLAANLTVIAVDESLEMLAEAKKKLGSRPGLSFRVGAATDIPIETGGVGYVFANMLLHHVEEPSLVLREMRRILKPGGVAIVTDLNPQEFSFLKTEQHDLWMGFERSQVGGWLREAGLEEVTIQDLQETCSSKSESGVNAEVTIFAAVARKPAKKTIK